MRGEIVARKTLVKSAVTSDRAHVDDSAAEETDRPADGECLTDEGRLRHRRRADVRVSLFL